MSAAYPIASKEPYHISGYRISFLLDGAHMHACVCMCADLLNANAHQTAYSQP